MGSASYTVVRVSSGWGVEHDGRREGSYATKEAAFEAIALAASNSIKEGYEVVIKVPGRRGEEAALGTPRGAD